MPNPITWDYGQVWLNQVEPGFPYAPFLRFLFSRWGSLPHPVHHMLSMPGLGLIQHTSPDQGVIKRDILDFLINRIYNFLINSYKMFTLHNLLPKHVSTIRNLLNMKNINHFVIYIWKEIWFWRCLHIFFLRFSYHFLFLVICLIELIE